MLRHKSCLTSINWRVRIAISQFLQNGSIQSEESHMLRASFDNYFSGIFQIVKSPNFSRNGWSYTVGGWVTTVKQAQSSLSVFLSSAYLCCIWIYRLSLVMLTCLLLKVRIVLVGNLRNVLAEIWNWPPDLEAKESPKEELDHSRWVGGRFHKRGNWQGLSWVPPGE